VIQRKFMFLLPNFRETDDMDFKAMVRAIRKKMSNKGYKSGAGLLTHMIRFNYEQGCFHSVHQARHSSGGWKGGGA